MIRLLLDVVLLWRTLPVVLNFFGVYKIIRETNEDGTTWTGTPGAAPGIEVVHPTQEDIAVSFLGTGYALYNLLFDGRS